MKRKKANEFFVSVSFVLIFLMVLSLPASAINSNILVSDETVFADLGLSCKSAVLMEAKTGEILYALNPDEALHPASVTKIMTLLLIMEEIDSGKLKYTDEVTASANAASMGGSQIFLKENEVMTVDDMLKSIVISSANDAAVAMAEHICGSESAFVSRMNERAKQLYMTNTNFENTNGLDDTTSNHKTSALDIAKMSKELIKHRKILEYSSIWMDSIRNGSFGLTNTNRLIRFYKGATGLKTGSTAKAGFCISATANRNGMELICVIMGAKTRDIRNEEAKKLLDYGYANYELYNCKAEKIDEIKVYAGKSDKVGIEHSDIYKVIEKGKINEIEKVFEFPNGIKAPCEKNTQIGTVKLKLDGDVLLESPLIFSDSVDKISFFEYLTRILKNIAVK